jgi:hypothetical protein
MMEEQEQQSPKKDPSFAPLMRSLALELAIYGPLVTLYFFIFLHFAEEYFTMLFGQDLTLYALFAILAIVGQGVLLEQLTSWLLRRVGLRQ